MSEEQGNAEATAADAEAAAVAGAAPATAGAPAAAEPTAEEQLAAAAAAAAKSRPKIPMTAPEGVTAVSVGGKELKITRGRIMVELEHVEQLIAHGFKVLVKDIKAAV